MLKGSCLCGGVHYEIAGELGAVTNCLGSLCRNMFGFGFFQRVDDPGGGVPGCCRTGFAQGMGIVAGISSCFLRTLRIADSKEER